MSSEAHSGNSVSLVVDDDPAKTRRAAVESMTIHSCENAMWEVYSGTKAVGYTVFALGGLSTWGCECPDHHYRGNVCKHIRRIQMCLGLRDIPETPGHSKPDVELMQDSRARVAAQRAARKADTEERTQEHRSDDSREVPA